MEQTGIFFWAWFAYSQFCIPDCCHKSNKPVGRAIFILDCKHFYMELAAFTCIGFNGNVKTRYFHKSSGTKIWNDYASLHTPIPWDNSPLDYYCSWLVHLYLWSSKCSWQQPIRNNKIGVPVGAGICFLHCQFVEWIHILCQRKGKLIICYSMQLIWITTSNFVKGLTAFILLKKIVFFQIQYLVLSASCASFVLVGLFLFVIFGVLPSKIEVIAGIFEANMVIGSIISCLLVRRII